MISSSAMACPLAAAPAASTAHGTPVRCREGAALALDVSPGRRGDGRIGHIRLPPPRRRGHDVRSPCPGIEFVAKGPDSMVARMIPGCCRSESATAQLRVPAVRTTAPAYRFGRSEASGRAPDSSRLRLPRSRPACVLASRRRQAGAYAKPTMLRRIGYRYRRLSVNTTHADADAQARPAIGFDRDNPH